MQKFVKNSFYFSNFPLVHNYGLFAKRLRAPQDLIYKVHCSRIVIFAKNAPMSAPNAARQKKSLERGQIFRRARNTGKEMP
jgi:hypothetical protein